MSLSSLSKITYCYHSHTYRCGHASGEDEDYIKKAIEFAVSVGYIIRDGKVCERVRGATLIGKGEEVLHNIDMVGNDLKRLFTKPRHITNHKAPAEGLYLNKVIYK